METTYVANSFSNQTEEREIRVWRKNEIAPNYKECPEQIYNWAHRVGRWEGKAPCISWMSVMPGGSMRKEKLSDDGMMSVRKANLSNSENVSIRMGHTRSFQRNQCQVYFLALAWFVLGGFPFPDDSKFSEAITVLLSWIERGEVNRRSANQFYSMVQSANSHVRRLMNEKATHEQEMEEAKENFKNALTGILTQCK